MSGSKRSAVIIAYIGMKMSGICPLGVIAAPINFPSWDIPMLQQTAVSLFPVEQEKLDLLTPPPPPEIQSFYLNGIPHNGNETRVFCYYGTPSGKPPFGGWPGIVLVHGAGGTAEHQWVKWWNDQGYAALSMDSAFRLPTASNWRLREKTCLPGPLFPWGTDPAWGVGRPQSQWPDNPEEYWFYHAISDVILINNFLRQRAEVNSDHIGTLGVSWGGVIASHVIGLDNRFAFGIPVYGCGFLHESNGAQSKIFKLRPEWDASVNLENADLPVFWASGATDLHFTPEDRFKSKQLSMGSEPNSVGSKWSRWFMLPTIPHSGTANYSETQFPEKINYVRFADAVIASMSANDGVPGDPEILRFTLQSLAADTAVIQYETETDVSDVTLFCTTSTNIWSEHTWNEMTEGASLTVNHSSKTIEADIPVGTTAYFINLTEGVGTESQLTISSDLFCLE